MTPQAEIRNTDLQVDVLLALNLHAMQSEPYDEDWPGVWASEIATSTGHSTRSVAACLSLMRTLGWVRSTHYEKVGWRLMRAGVDALEANRERTRGRLGGAPR